MSTKKSMLPSQQKKAVVEENNKKMEVDVPKFDYYMNGQFTNKLDINNSANPPVFCYNTPYIVDKYCVVYIEQNVTSNVINNDYINIVSGFYLGLIQPGMAMNVMLVYDEPMTVDPRVANVMGDVLKFKPINDLYDNVHKIYESRNLSECFTVLAQIKHKYTSMVNSLIEEFTAMNNTDDRECPLYCSVRKLSSDGSMTFIPLIKNTLPEDKSDTMYRPLIPTPNNKDLYDIYNLPEDTKVVFKTDDFNEMTEYINKMGGDE